MSLLEGYRLFTGYYIYESEMPSEAKLGFIRFLKEASADDIIDILSGEYEGVDALTEEDMEAVNNFLEGKFSTAAAVAGKGAKAAGKGAAVAGKAVGKGAMYAGGKVKAGTAVAGKGVWTGSKWVSRKAWAGMKATGRGAGKVGAGTKKALGWEKVAAVKKAGKTGGVEPGRYKKAVRSAIGRTALAGGGVAGAAGGAYAYKKSK